VTKPLTELQIAKKLPTLTIDLAERQILHGYAVWHHLRRLRRRLGEQHTNRLQDLNVRCHVTVAADFLDWPGARDRALAD
jgi:hypothetical protein